METAREQRSVLSAVQRGGAAQAVGGHVGAHQQRWQPRLPHGLYAPWSAGTTSQI